MLTGVALIPQTSHSFGVGGLVFVFGIVFVIVLGLVLCTDGEASPGAVLHTGAGGRLHTVPVACQNEAQTADIVTSKAAVGGCRGNDLLSGRSRVRVAVGAQVIYQPRRPTDEPPGGGWRIRAYTERRRAPGRRALENGPRGGSRPRAPLVWLRSPRFFTPTVLRGRGRIFPAPARGEPRTPVNQSVNEMRRARLRRERCRAP